MEKEIKFIFPFKINEKSHTALFKVELVRKEATISFSLPFLLHLQIENAILNKFSKIENNYLFVFTFSELIYAKEFINDPKINVINETVYKNVDDLEKEANKFLDAYEERGKKRKKESFNRT